jgi:hypothetical protein
MVFKLINTYSEGDYDEYETFECSNCHRHYTVHAGGDIACCMCEFDNESEEDDA